MKIKFEQNTIHAGAHYKAGSVVKVEDELGAAIIKRGVASEAKPGKPEKPESVPTN